MKHGIVHSRSQALIDYAYEFAEDAHEGQVRKYTGEPYIVHPVAVARIVASVAEDVNMVCAALLHGVIEDTPVTYQTLSMSGFMWPIPDLVADLSDVSVLSDGNRAARKAIDREHTAQASPDAKTIKLADLINNAESILRYDPNFAKVFMKEMRLLLNVLTEGDSTLYAQAKNIVDLY